MSHYVEMLAYVKRCLYKTTAPLGKKGVKPCDLLGASRSPGTTPMRWIGSVLVILLACTVGYSQDVSSEMLTLYIKEQALTIDSLSLSVSVTLTFRNDSDHDLIVYGLTGELQAAPTSLSGLCRPDVGTGLAMAFYHDDGTQEMPTVQMAGYAKAKAYKMPDSIRKTGETAFVKSKLVIAKGEEQFFVKEIPVEDFYLEKGSYSLEVVYYCGNKISNVVNVKKVNKGKASLFQGCALAKRVPVTIR